jgi:hypothetical protein
MHTFLSIQGKVNNNDGNTSRWVIGCVQITLASSAKYGHMNAIR